MLDLHLFATQEYCRFSQPWNSKESDAKTPMSLQITDSSSRLREHVVEVRNRNRGIRHGRMHAWFAGVLQRSRRRPRCRMLHKLDILTHTHGSRPIARLRNAQNTYVMYIKHNLSFNERPVALGGAQSSVATSNDRHGWLLLVVRFHPQPAV